MRPLPSAPLLTRRMAVGLTLGAGAAWALGAAAERLPLITKAIPVSGERLPVIGLGTDSFRARERDAIVAEIRRMPQLGGTVIDTSADYGDSEALIGDALTKLAMRDHIFLATKLTASGGFFDVGGARSFERSLKRLQTAKLDLLQVHNLDGVDELMPMLQAWKHEGRIRYIGITTSVNEQHAATVHYLRKYPLDFVQVDYSISNRDAARTVLPEALQRRVAVLINVPFGSGGTLRDALARPLPPWAAEIDVTSWAQYLLKYVVSHPAVTCAIPGSTRIAHLVDNQGAARGRLPDAAMRSRMEQYWDSA